MTLAVSNQNTGTSTTANTTATITATTSGNLVVAIFARSGGLATGALTSVTDSSSQTWTRATRGAMSGVTYTRVELWYVENSASITSVTFNSGTAQNNSWNIFEVSGAATSSSLDVASTDNSSAASGTTVTTPSITTSNANNIIIACEHHPSNFTDTNGDGTYTDLTAFDFASGGNARAAYKIVSSTGSYSDNWTITGGTPGGFGVLTVAFKASGSTAISSSDSSSGSESQTIATTLSSSDSGSGSESNSLSVTLSSSDSRTATDSQSVNTGSGSKPTGLVATPVSTTQINLTWNAFSGATGYDIERNGAIVATNVAGTSYNDTGLSPNTTYTYRVRAVLS